MRHISDEVLIAYIEGDMDSRERERVRKHLESCDICMDNYRAYVSIVRSLEELPPIQAPGSLDAMVESRVGIHRPYPIIGAVAFSFFVVAILILLPGLTSRLMLWLMEYMNGKLLISLMVRGMELLVGVFTLLFHFVNPLDALWGLVLLSIVMAIMVKRRLERYADTVN